MGFARFSDQRGHRGPITEQLILDLVQGCAKRATPFTWARRLQTIRAFARFCFRLDLATYISEKMTRSRAQPEVAKLRLFPTDSSVESPLCSGSQVLIPAAGSAKRRCR
jgi:hypothetical protein